MLTYEMEAQIRGFGRIAGVDEAGRGPLAGPVVAAAVILREVSFKSRVDDSKKLTDGLRRGAFPEIFQKGDVGIGIIDPEMIDQVNILEATLLAMREAIDNLSDSPDYVLVDGLQFPNLVKNKSIQVGVVRGDQKSLSIACASIVAKVTRDNLMIELDRQYPQYGFAKHKGYGTKEHLEAIAQYGLSPVHRKTFIDPAYLVCHSEQAPTALLGAKPSSGGEVEESHVLEA
jgi:ribonuclease HII